MIRLCDLQRCTYVDESGVNLAMLAALALHDSETVMTSAGATEPEVFSAYTEQVLGPTRRPGDVVVWDQW